MEHVFQDIKDIISMARHDIISLRRQNEILSAKVQVVEAFSLALNARPPELVYTMDVAPKLQMALDCFDERIERMCSKARNIDGDQATRD
jgi:hypothetical protein